MDNVTLGLVLIAVAAVDIPIGLFVAMRASPSQRPVILAAIFAGSATIAGLGVAFLMGWLGAGG